MIHKGSCLCGGVAFEVHGKMRPVIYCHCTQCRKQTGHFMAATSCAREDLRMLREEGLKWYRSSSTAERAFCANCGSTLFWQGDKLSGISIAAGVLDGKTDLTIEGHIYCADKGSYYEIPANEGYRKAQWED